LNTYMGHRVCEAFLYTRAEQDELELEVSYTKMKAAIKLLPIEKDCVVSDNNTWR